MKILVGYNAANTGKKFLDAAAKHTKALNAQVLLVTSMPGGEKSDENDILKAQEALDSAKAYLEDAGVNCEVHLLVRGLEAGEDILKFAKEKDVEEIIIGVKNRSKVGKLIFGSTAQAVILEAECPVLAVK